MIGPDELQIMAEEAINALRAMSPGAPLVAVLVLGIMEPGVDLRHTGFQVRATLDDEALQVVVERLLETLEKKRMPAMGSA